MDIGGFLNGLTSAMGLLLLVYVLVVAGIIFVGLWITYTVMWRAVRRGLREYHEPQISAAVARTQRGPRDW